MGKFKLIKEYPGSPKLGEIWGINKFCSKFWPYDYPDYWQELRDIKVINGRKIYHGGCLDCVTNQSLCSGCQYFDPNWNLPDLSTREKDYEILEMLNTSGMMYTVKPYENLNWELRHHKIYKIRRKSDGVEFKIGDRVKATDNYYWNGIKFIERNSGWWNPYYYNTTIKEFKVIPEGMLIIYNSEKATHGQLIQHVEKIKEPILTTEDGYECTLDDRVFGVCIKGSWETCVKEVSTATLFIQNKHKEKSAWLYFKTAENRDKYIYENKPEFSRKQINEAIDNISSPLRWFDVNVLKQKLNL